MAQPGPADPRARTRTKAVSQPHYAEILNDDRAHMRASMKGEFQDESPTTTAQGRKL
jgi:hypothetical protein